MGEAVDGKLFIDAVTAERNNFPSAEAELRPTKVGETECRTDKSTHYKLNSEQMHDTPYNYQMRRRPRSYVELHFQYWNTQYATVIKEPTNKGESIQKFCQI